MGMQAFVDEFLSFLPEQAPAREIAQRTGGQSADQAAVSSIVERMQDRWPALWEGIWQACGDEPGYESQSRADFCLVNDIARGAVRLGVADTALHATIRAVFCQSGLFRPEKLRTIENDAIPKAIADALKTRQAAEAVSTHEDGGKTLAEHEPGDIMAARVFGETYRGKLIHVTPTGRWMLWDNTRWLGAARGEEMRAAKSLADQVLSWAFDLLKQDAEKHKKRFSFAQRLQNQPRLEAMLELAKSEPGMSIGYMTELDADPWLLGVRNGVVNLKDGSLLTASPDMLITRQCAAEYDPDAQCPRWIEFLISIFEGDEDTIAFVQRALGYTLTGTTTEEALFICHGFGANGKSVFGNVITSIMADNAQAAPPSLLTMRKDGDAGPRNDIARLCGARLVQINELQQGDRLDEQVVKMLAGREMLSARFLHKEFFEFWPTAKPWLRTNHRPVVTGEDCGIWRRLHLIPFKRKFEEHERDPWLESRLLEERDGILAWMVQGCLDWQRGGLRPSAMVRRESAVYRRESDLLGEFLEECTENDKEARIEQQQLFARWRLWNDANGTRSGSKTSFTRKMAERGYTGAKSNGQRFYSGLKATR